MPDDESSDLFPRLVAIHASAVRNLADGRQRLLDLAEKERQLVSADWVRSVMLDHDGAVAQLLRAMPRQLAGRDGEWLWPLHTAILMGDPFRVALAA